LYFLDFDHYKKNINKKKKISDPVIQDLGGWGKRMDDLESIRNAIMHCRGQYLSSERISRLKESCIELQKLVQKVEQREK